MELRGLNNPIEVASATVSVKSDRTDVQGISASVAGGHWNGSLSLPRPCFALPNCAITFTLQADNVSTERIGKFVNSRPTKPWYRFLTPEKSSGGSVLSRLNASGRLSVVQFAIRGLTASHATANVAVQNGLLRISDLRAETLGGTHYGKWDVDFNAKPPRYSGEGTFDQVSLEKLATAMHSAWITGTGEARYQVKSSGSNLPDLIDAAAGTLEVELSDGKFTTVLLDRSPLRLDHFSGALALKSGEFRIDDGSLETPAATYMVSGTASLSGELDFKLTRDKNSRLDVTGTLDEPHVLAVRAPSTEAVLKR